MLGVLRIDDFLDRTSCRDLMNEMRSAPYEPATVSGGDTEPGTLDEQQRRAHALELSAATTFRLHERLLGARPRIEAHFGMALGEPEPPQFLTYGPGGFQVPHRDVGDSPAGYRRSISAVLFVNDQAEESDGDRYSGGSLVLYGLLGPASIQHGIPVGGRSGQLVAFQSDVLHEVKAVEDGQRHTAVAWYPPGDEPG